MQKSLLQNRINPKVKQRFHRYSQLVGVPMNKLVEGFIEDGMKSGRNGLDGRLREGVEFALRGKKDEKV